MSRAATAAGDWRDIWQDHRQEYGQDFGPSAAQGYGPGPAAPIATRVRKRDHWQVSQPTHWQQHGTAWLIAVFGLLGCGLVAGGVYLFSQMPAKPIDLKPVRAGCGQMNLSSTPPAGYDEATWAYRKHICDGSDGHMHMVYVWYPPAN